jgi:hypothetical protein
MQAMARGDIADETALISCRRFSLLGRFDIRSGIFYEARGV